MTQHTPETPPAPVRVDRVQLGLMLRELRLPTMKGLWEKFSERADAEGWPAARFLAALAEHELAERARRRVERHLRDARLLPGKSLANFEFPAVPMLSKAQVMALAAGDLWLGQGANLLLFGPPGCGKSHVAAAIGRALVEHGYRVLFSRTTDLVQQMQRARATRPPRPDAPPPRWRLHPTNRTHPRRPVLAPQITHHRLVTPRIPVIPNQRLVNQANLARPTLPKKPPVSQTLLDRLHHLPIPVQRRRLTRARPSSLSPAPRRFSRYRTAPSVTLRSFARRLTDAPLSRIPPATRTSSTVNFMRPSSGAPMVPSDFLSSSLGAHPGA